MSPKGETPLSERRRLRVALRNARDALKLTQKDVAEALDWSTSKLVRIEHGSVGISVTDLKALLAHYGITDPGNVEAMVAMARASKKSVWWDSYRDFVSPQFLIFLGLEASTIRLRQFQGLLVPGLLQSRQYIHELLLLGPNDAEGVRRGTELRLRRQDIISADGPDMIFIIDESVLYRRVGDNSVMREQLLKIREIATHPQVTIQVMPFSAGVHKGMKSSFEILELSDEPDDYALLLEHPYKDNLIPDPSDETKEFVEIFVELEKIALPASETPRLIDKRLEMMDKEG